jgi:hypothetical protein
MTQTRAVVPLARRRLWATSDGRRLITGAVLLVVILFGQSVYGMATASSRLDPSLRNATGPSNVVVVLDFMPDRFHNERVAEYGTFAGRDGALNRLRLRYVSPDNLRALSSVAWISRIEPFK